MFMHSEEFTLGTIFLVLGSLLLLERWVIGNTRFGRPLKETDEKLASEGFLFGSRISFMDMMLGLGFMSLFAGSVLLVVAFFAYGGLS